MKYNNTLARFLLISIVVLFIYSCSANKNNNNSSANFPGEAADSLVAYLERTPCFGVCPYYTIKIYRSGYVLYEGKKNVKNIGRFYTQLTSKQLESIGEKAIQLGYFDLEDSYRNPHLTDFPTIYSEVRFRGKQKKITHYHSEPPAALVEMENFIDSLFTDETKWNLHPQQDKK